MTKKYKLFNMVKTRQDWITEFPYLWGKDFLKYGFEEVSEPVKENVSGLVFDSAKEWFGMWDYKYTLATRIKIPQYKLPVIKEYIECALNDGIPQRIKDIISTYEEVIEGYKKKLSALNDTVVEDNAFVSEYKVSVGDTFKGEKVDYVGLRRNAVVIGTKQSKQSSTIPTTPTQPIVEDERECAFDKEKINKRMKELLENPQKYTLKYTQEQMDKAIEDAFKAARKKEYDYYDWETENDKFPTIQDYINHLKQNK